MKRLDMNRSYDNIIIAAHALDILVFFYDFISEHSLIILCTTPKSINDFNSLNTLIIKKGAELIILDDEDTYLPTYILTDATKFVLNNVLNNITMYKSEKIITQVRATIESDKIARDIYDYCESLKLHNHYVINIENNIENNIDNNNKINKINKKIPQLFLDIAKYFTNGSVSRVEYLTMIYSLINGLIKI